ncbi:hypothetical protein ABFY53_26040 [Serratia nematodiphila]
MNIDDELQALSEQEATLAFTHFDAATAWELGAALKTPRAATARPEHRHRGSNWPGRRCFITPCRGQRRTLPTGCGGKRNLVNHFHKSSYAIGLRLQQRQTVAGGALRAERA